MILGRNANYSYSNIEFYRDGNILPVPCGHNWGGWQYMLPQVPTRIGAPLKGGTVPYVGKLDELVVWNRALSQAEINDVLSEQPVRYLWSTGDTTQALPLIPCIQPPIMLQLRTVFIAVLIALPSKLRPTHYLLTF